MKKIKKMMLVSMLATGMVACNKTITGEGPDIAENRPVTGFTGIDLRMKADIYFQQGTGLNMELIGQENLLNGLETKLENNQLVIQYAAGKYFTSHENIRIQLTAQDVNSFLLNSPGNIYCLNDQQVASLKLVNNGEGIISLKNVFARTVEATTTSSGDITALGGTSINKKVTASGTGKIDLSGVLARTAVVNNSGSGKVQVRVADHLVATIGGSGPVYYSGYPDVSSHISGTGRLVHF